MNKITLLRTSLVKWVIDVVRFGSHVLHISKPYGTPETA